MTLIKSISGIRGTIGGAPNENLTPIDAVQFASAYGKWLQESFPNEKLKVVIGRDARISGPMISELVANTLIGCGIDVMDVGLSTTPTVEVMVPHLKAHGGIILTASHNPKQWNALKLLNHKGEFISGADGEKLLEFIEKGDFYYAEVDDLGVKTTFEDAIDIHIEQILNLPLVNADAIRAKKIKVVVDAVNSTGGIAIPKLLNQLGVEGIYIHCEPNGHFPHNPEPLPEHLQDLVEKVKEEKADLGITVDPDVDRLAMVCEDGSMFGEEYTLVAVADYILGKTPSATVSNLSSSRALRDVTEKHGQTYHTSAVGEVNVVEKMKEVNAIIGGEGNGGIILPELHYGRDALVGIALFLSHLAEKNMSCKELKDSYPAYFASKNKIQLTPAVDVDDILKKMEEKYVDQKPNTIDGVKLDLAESWWHLRKSNTEPIIRVYTEAKSQAAADELAQKVIKEIEEII